MEGRQGLGPPCAVPASHHGALGPEGTSDGRGTCVIDNSQRKTSLCRFVAIIAKLIQYLLNYDGNDSIC